MKIHDLEAKVCTQTLSLSMVMISRHVGSSEKITKVWFFEISTFYHFCSVLCYFLKSAFLRKNETLVIFSEEPTSRNIMTIERERLQVHSSGFSVVDLSGDQ